MCRLILKVSFQIIMPGYFHPTTIPIGGKFKMKSLSKMMDALMKR